LVLIGGITYAAFMDKGSVLGSSFSVGSSDIKLLADLSGNLDSSNLVDELVGPSFNNIIPYWQQDYLIKIYNNASAKIVLTSNSLYETAQDTEDLRQIIFVEPLEWLDTNANGLLDEGETGISYGKKTIIKWKTEGISLGEIPQGDIKGLILRFSTETVSDTKQGATALFDFEFNATQPTE
jgi:hypothetical protein